MAHLLPERLPKLAPPLPIRQSGQRLELRPRRNSSKFSLVRLHHGAEERRSRARSRSTPAWRPMPPQMPVPTLHPSRLAATRGEGCEPPKSHQDRSRQAWNGRPPKPPMARAAMWNGPRAVPPIETCRGPNRLEPRLFCCQWETSGVASERGAFDGDLQPGRPSHGCSVPSESRPHCKVAVSQISKYCGRNLILQREERRKPWS